MRERWDRVREIFAGAFELGAAAQATYLERACDGDGGLRTEVEQLLEQARAPGDFLEPAGVPEVEDRVGQRIGSYDIVEVVGSGGMGTVYAAWQQQPRRLVALKVMGLGFAAAENAQRFRFEAEILGRLRHPAIAQVYEAGVHEGPESARMPWLAMEFVEGAQPIVAYARQHGLPPAARLQLFGQVCDAVHHAHQRGVIHRDLKPDNILVDAQGRPKVVDFGIARAVEQAPAAADARTRPGQLVGTLSYMSPQQCAVAPGDVDVRTDVYSLGLVLYELATGVRAHDLGDTSLYDALRIIRDEEPRRPASIAPACRGDLETIILKAIEKDADRRYASVTDLAADLGRFLRREPIAARRATALHRLRLLAARNPVATAASTLAVVALVVGAIASTGFALREQQSARVAEEINAFVNRDLLGAADPWLGADPDLTVRDALDAAADKIGGRFPDEPRVEAGVRTSIGNGFFAIGLMAQARPHLERAVEILAREHGSRDARTVRARILLAGALVQLGEAGAAEVLTTELLDDVPDGSNRAGIFATRSAMLMRAGRYEAALAACRAGLEFAAREGPEAWMSFVLRNGEAEALRRLAKLPEAEELHRETLARSERELGSRHPRTLSLRANLALVLQDTGRLDDARQLLEQALAGNIESLGARHYQTLVVRRNLALLLSRLERHDDAEAQAADALAGMQATLGDDHAMTLATLMVLANVHMARGRIDDAEPILRQVVKGLAEKRTADPALLGEATLHLARVLAARAETTEAIALLEDALGAVPQGEDSEVTLALRNQLGTLLRRAGRPAEAEPILAHVATQMRARMGTHMGTAVSLRNHAHCLRELQRPADARRILLEAHAILVELTGADSPLARKVASELESLPPDK